MRWLFGVWIGAFVLSLLGAAAYVALGRLPASTERFVDLAAAPLPRTALPAGSIVLTAADVRALDPPFSAERSALAIPEGAASKTLSGRAQFAFNTPAAGSAQLWLRTLWRDSCGNSVGVKVNAAPDSTAGNDAVYNQWHWVPAGTVQLTAGENHLTLLEREDGVALDQILLTPDAAFLPTGAIGPAGAARDVRRFADDFLRSPGHGNEAWTLDDSVWKIAFSFDPNRIPNQYALVGHANARSVAEIKGAPWNGAELGVCVYPDPGSVCGVTFDSSASGTSAVLLRAAADGSTDSTLEFAGRTVALGRAYRPGQWHRIVVERWGFTLRVRLDGQVVCAQHDLQPAGGGLGLLIERGTAVFDDLDVVEIPWLGDAPQPLDPATLAPWSPAAQARWQHAAPPDSSPEPQAANARRPALVGKAGAIRTKLEGFRIAEVLLDEDPAARAEVQAAGLVPADPCPAGSAPPKTPAAPHAGPTVRLWTAELGNNAAGGEELELRAPAGGEARVHRVAVRFAPASEAERRDPHAAPLVLGPFHFTEPEFEDPSDYLDFTPEEYAEMAKSPEAEKLRRQAKFKPIIGYRNDDESPFVRESGSWRIREGTLNGYGQGALLRCAQEFNGPAELTFRLRLSDPGSALELDLYAGPDPAQRVRIGGTRPERIAPPVAGFLHVPLEHGSAWHAVRVNASPGRTTVQLDEGAPLVLTAPAGDGGRFALRVLGQRVELDDLELRLDRCGPGLAPHAGGALAGFRRRETDWWRDGGDWIDHGGIACVLASSWISLAAHGQAGLLWHKQSFSGDLRVAFDVEENSEWHGWDRWPSHVHYPYDNLQIVLAPGSAVDDPQRTPGSAPQSGYRLEVNADRRRATILYRNGVEVARVRQDGYFPIHFVNGHMPYFPRRNRVMLARHGGVLRAVINGREVLRYSDPEPLETERAAIGGYNTRANFSHIEVRPATAPQPGSGEAAK